MRRYGRSPLSFGIRLRWLNAVGVLFAFVSLLPLLRHRPLGPPWSEPASGKAARAFFWLGQASRAACAWFGLDWPFDP